MDYAARLSPRCVACVRRGGVDAGAVVVDDENVPALVIRKNCSEHLKECPMADQPSAKEAVLRICS